MGTPGKWRAGKANGLRIASGREWQKKREGGLNDSPSAPEWVHMVRENEGNGNEEKERKIIFREDIRDIKEMAGVEIQD